jgi:uncharacterized protein YbcV (DUF1398 family)
MSLTNEQRETIARCKTGSLEGTMNFVENLALLSRAGVQSYFADFRGGQTTYYLNSRTADAHALPLPQPDMAIADAFDAAAVRNAVARSQRGELPYRDFIRATRAAGCVGYNVWLEGRQVQYYGRRGEQHVERFPD